MGTCSSRSDRFGAGFNWENRLLWSCWSQEVMGSYLHTFLESHVMTQGHPLVTTCENILALSKDYVCTHALSMSVFRRLMSAVLPSHPLPTFRSLKTALAIGHRSLVNIRGQRSTGKHESTRDLLLFGGGDGGGF